MATTEVQELTKALHDWHSAIWGGTNAEAKEAEAKVEALRTQHGDDNYRTALDLLNASLSRS